MINYNENNLCDAFFFNDFPLPSYLEISTFFLNGPEILNGSIDQIVSII